jgi:hypothetical protein
MGDDDFHRFTAYGASTQTLCFYFRYCGGDPGAYDSIWYADIADGG